MQLWCLKGTVLVFYRRLAIDRWQEILLKITTWFCAATFIGLMCVLTFSCFPYHENWQVWPRPPPWCSAKPKLLIATSCLNAFTDIMVGVCSLQKHFLTSSASNNSGSASLEIDSPAYKVAIPALFQESN